MPPVSVWLSRKLSGVSSLAGAVNDSSALPEARASSPAEVSGSLVLTLAALSHFSKSPRFRPATPPVAFWPRILPETEHPAISPGLLVPPGNAAHGGVTLHGAPERTVSDGSGVDAGDAAHRGAAPLRRPRLPETWRS